MNFGRRQFPNCVGVIDDNYVRVKKPPKSGSLYFNYKNYFLIVLLALADAHLCFILADVGSFSSQGDTRIPFTAEPSILLAIMADKAFRLAENQMNLYSGYGLSHKQKIFNYYLSRARLGCGMPMWLLHSKVVNTHVLHAVGC